MLDCDESQYSSSGEDACGLAFFKWSPRNKLDTTELTFQRAVMTGSLFSCHALHQRRRGSTEVLNTSTLLYSMA
ncbi:hypothetical protein PR202_gb29444 [Eleusine coracana subsp. coracana]|uniref:Uncharacterized protein n=1 Tax=Eleusine coracana subsp. coracana TaxID=191504 RepID=A0AAV5FZ04_ELECO|nr:hypothetical protein PR202_gb29444 [Eleusine coracana subsp. coracana]